MPKLLERKMNQALLEQHHNHVVLTEEKAEKLIPVIEQILSRHYGRKIKISDYRIQFRNTSSD